MFGFGRRKCRECGSELAEMGALRDRSDDLMKNSALGSADPIADICAVCRLKLTKSSQSLAMNLHVMEARRAEAEAKAADTPAPPPAKREIAQIVQGGSEAPKPAYQSGGGYKTEEEKSALFDAPSFDEIKGLPDLLLWAIGTGAGRRVAAAAFLFLVMIINSISNDDDYQPADVPAATELPSAQEPMPPPPAAPIPTAFARPANNPGSWATTDDYPIRALNEQREGTAAFMLTVNPQGAVTDCLITQSSGHDDLDMATCTAITKRARFERAPVETPDRGYRNRVTWRIPE